MIDPSQTWVQMTLPDMIEPISSQASEDGLSPLRSPDMTAPSGPGAVHVSRSPQPGKAVASTIPVISGPCGSVSSEPAFPRSSLVSRFQAPKGSAGSILYSQTWKVRVTPSGRRISALRAAARRTSDSDSTGGLRGWGTPTVQASNGNGYQRDSKTGEKILTLVGQAKLVGWGTVTADDSKGVDYTYSNGDHSKPYLMLQGQAKLAGWGTVTARACKGPSSIDVKGARTKGRLEVEAAISGPTSNGSLAEMASSGRLNPAFCLWLMGYPEEWLEAFEASVMQSSRKPVRRGLKKCSKGAENE